MASRFNYFFNLYVESVHTHVEELENSFGKHKAYGENLFIDVDELLALFCFGSNNVFFFSIVKVYVSLFSIDN